MGKFPLELLPEPIPRTISLVGSGGKTTLLFLLAQEIQKRSLPTAVCTTTHILPPQESSSLKVIVHQTPFPVEETLERIRRVLEKGQIPVCATPAENGKLGAPPKEVFSFLRKETKVLLLESDGSRRLPLKYPNDTEPVLLPETEEVIAIAGLSALGNPLADCCHRFPLAMERLGLASDAVASPETIAALLYGGYARYSPFMVLNQADTPELRDAGELTASRLRHWGIKRVLVTSLI